jgi:hypothetical protein
LKPAGETPCTIQRKADPREHGSQFAMNFDLDATKPARAYPDRLASRHCDDQNATDRPAFTLCRALSPNLLPTPAPYSPV